MEKRNRRFYRDEGVTMNYLGYEGIEKYSIEDNCYYGKIIKIDNKEISDLILYEGKTEEELEKNFKEIVKEYKELRESVN